MKATVIQIITTLIIVTTISIAQGKKSDEAIAQEFQTQYKTLLTKIELATTIEQFAEIDNSIDELETKYLSSEEVLNKAFYPNYSFIGKIEKIRRNLEDAKERTISNNLVILGYWIYLPISILLTFWTSKMLFKNGRIFMMDIFHGNEKLALSTNKLFEIGYFLLNVGFALLILEMKHVENTRDLIESLSTKIGGFTIYLGIVFMLNVVLFMRGRKNAMRNKTVNTIQQQ